jgi:hypothetical protein
MTTATDGAGSNAFGFNAKMGVCWNTVYIWPDGRRKDSQYSANKSVCAVTKNTPTHSGMLQQWFNWRTGLALIAMAIVITTIFYSRYLARTIAAEERQQVEAWQRRNNISLRHRRKRTSLSRPSSWPARPPSP